MAPDRGAGELIYSEEELPVAGPLESRPFENEDKGRFHVCISNPCLGLHAVARGRRCPRRRAEAGGQDRVEAIQRNPATTGVRSPLATLAKCKAAAAAVSTTLS